MLCLRWPRSRVRSSVISHPFFNFCVALISFRACLHEGRGPQIFIIDWSQFNKNVRIEWLHCGSFWSNWLLPGLYDRPFITIFLLLLSGGNGEFAVHLSNNRIVYGKAFIQHMVEVNLIKFITIKQKIPRPDAVDWGELENWTLAMITELVALKLRYCITLR